MERVEYGPTDGANLFDQIIALWLNRRCELGWRCFVGDSLPVRGSKTALRLILFTLSRLGRLRVIYEG